MKITIIGSNSLLASYIIDEFISRNAFLHLYGKSDTLGDLNYKSYVFSNFTYPQSQIDYDKLLECDLIVYCIANGVQAAKAEDTAIIYDVNAFLPIQILNFLNTNNFKGQWVSFGSYFEIGNNAEDIYFEEASVIGSTLDIPNHYCSSKRLLSRFLSNKLLNIRYFHLILPTIYGAKENQNRIIPYIVHGLKNNSPIQLSAGTQIRQYLHCKDVVSLITVLNTSNVESGIYNVSDNESVRISDLVKCIFDIFKKDSSPYLGTLNTRDENMKVLKLNGNKIKTNIPQWKPEISLSEGLQEYLLHIN